MNMSLYRKYRPNVFADVVGQEHVENTLVNAVREGNVAHAYLFCGPRGTGKTTTARLLAKALDCESGPCKEPDGTCEQCRAIAEGTHPDVYELDAASRTGVENVRDEIISRVNFAPTRGRMKVYIIDEVHMLSTGAFNALLKTLEEPPSHVVFVLCTTEARKVPATIQSRCQRFDFRRLSDDEIVDYLERICEGEGFSYERDALEELAEKSAGGMRDATTSLEQVAVFSDGKVTRESIGELFGEFDEQGLFELADRIASRDTAGCFTWLDGYVAKGADLSELASGLAKHMRDLYAVSLCGTEQGVVSGSAETLARYREQARSFGGPERLSRAMTVAGGLSSELKSSSDQRLSVEVALTKLCRPESDLTLEALEERIAALEAGASAAQPAASPRQDRPAERDWGSARPSEPVWKQQARENAQAPKRRSPERAGVPLEEAVKREAEREEAEEYEREARQTAPAPQARTAPSAVPEAPRPQAASPSRPVSGGMSPARTLAALLTVVKRQDVATGALLAGVTLEEDGERCTLVFPEGAEFQMHIASSGEARKLIGKAFEEVLGRRVSFTCRLGGAEKAASSPAPSANTGTGGSAPAPEEGGDAEDAPVYEDGYDYGGYDEEGAEDFEAQPAPSRSEAASEVADALAVFGEGVTVQEIDE